MAETWQDRFHAILAEILREKYDVEDAVKVTGFYESSYDMGCCETCSYTVHELDVYYLDSQGESRTHSIEGRMSDFIGM